MLTPNGQPADKLEKVMLLSMWARTLEEERRQQTLSNSKKIIFAGLGKPTYPINPHTISSFKSYWLTMEALANQWHLNPEEMEENSAIDYGDPRGDLAPKTLMSKVMSAWYKTEIQPDNILFTIGGIGALRIIFEALATRYEKTRGYRIITPFPHYSAYSNYPFHKLHPIDVMQEPGYKLTAHAMERSIKEAYRLAEIDNIYPKAVLICNPSNPLGTLIDEEEFIKIADVLRLYPELHLIFDEAYTEMCFVNRPSFLNIANDLKERTLILRSATKALSAAGERMAILMVFEQSMMNELLNKTVSHFVHAPRSAQMAYAQTMANLDSVEQQKMITFYKTKVDYVIARLQAIGASMPDPLYQVEATFYALGDFSDLLGLDLPNEAQRALQRTGTINTGEELAYYLLFKDALMLAPLCYFGLPENCGFMRITCSGSSQELPEMMNRLEQRLFKARKIKKLTLLEKVTTQLSELACIDTILYESMLKQIRWLSHEEDTCLSLKEKNHKLMEFDEILNNVFINRGSLLFENNKKKTRQTVNSTISLLHHATETCLLEE